MNLSNYEIRIFFKFSNLTFKFSYSIWRKFKYFKTENNYNYKIIYITYQRYLSFSQPYFQNMSWFQNIQIFDIYING